MLNANNLIIANAIARAYCEDNLTCLNSLKERLNLFFNDAQFAGLLANLTSRRYYFGSYRLPMVKILNGLQYKTLFNYTDIITGDTGTADVTLPGAIYNPANTDWKRVTEYTNAPYLSFSHIVGDKIVFSSVQHGGYQIAYTTNPTSGGDPTSGGGSQSGGGSSSGGGKIIYQSQNTPMPTVKTIDVPNVSTGFDLKSLIIPGAILAAVLMMRKF